MLFAVFGGWLFGEMKGAWVMFQPRFSIWVMVLFCVPLALGEDHWPQFRGVYAAGHGGEQGLPESWDVETGANVAWKLAIPGQSYASPITWGDTVFVVTVTSAGQEAGQDNEAKENGQPLEYRWEVWSIHLRTGGVLWRKVVHSATWPAEKSNQIPQPHSTPATDGKVVVAMFGTQGLHALTTSGELLWKKDFGKLNIGDFEGPDSSWYHASSPILQNGIVYLQCDTPKESFLVAFDSQTGKEVWRAAREELASLGSPAYVPGQPDEIVANGAHFIRGYNAATGKELWKVAASGVQCTTPTPIFNREHIVVASGKRQVKPVYAIKRGVHGDQMHGKGNTLDGAVAWRKKGRGPNLPTPIIAGDLLYILQDKGILDCYELATGEEVYRQRIPGGAFTASPVVADGNLYIASVDGDVFVVPEGRNFQIKSRIGMEEELYATPAIAKKTLLIRGKQHLFAIRGQ